MRRYDHIVTEALKINPTPDAEEWQPEETPSASWEAYIKAGFVDKPMFEIPIYAADRFPNESKEQREARYRIDKGRIIFKGDDGEWHPEVGSSLWTKAKRFAGEQVAMIPEELAAASTPVTGPLGPLLAGGMELGRQAVGKYAFGEEKSPLEIGGRAVGSAVFAKVGDVLGKALTVYRNSRRLKKGKGMRFAGADAISELSPEDKAKAVYIDGLAKKEGVKLPHHALYDKQGMTDVWSYMSQHPQTSDAVRAFKDTMAKEVDTAIERGIKNISGVEDVATVGSDLVDTSIDVIKGMKKTRADATRPIYTKAFKAVGADKVEIAPIVAELNAMIAASTRGSGTEKALRRIKGMFYRKGEKGKLVLQTNLRNLDTIKKEITKIVGAPSLDYTKSILPETKTRLLDIQREMVELLKETSPEYEHALTVHKLMSPKIEAVEQGVLGQLSRTTKDTQIINAVDNIFKGKSIRLILDTKRYIQGADPKLWNRTVGSFLRNTWEGIVETEGGKIINAGGKFHKLLYGSTTRRNKMKVALDPQQFKNLDGLMTVLQRAAIGHGKESMTMPFAEIAKAFGKITSGKAYRFAMFTKQATVESIFGWWNDAIVKGNMDKLMTALMDTKLETQMRLITKMKPSSEKGLRALSSFMSVFAGKVMEDEVLQ